MDLAKEVLSAAKALYDQCKQAQDNREECAALSVRVVTVIDIAARLAGNAAYAQGHAEALAALRGVLDNAKGLVDKLALRDKTLRGKALNWIAARQVAAQLDGFNEELARLVGVLTLGAAADAAAAGQALYDNLRAVEWQVGGVRAEMQAGVGAVLARLQEQERKIHGSLSLDAIRALLAEMKADLKAELVGGSGGAHDGGGSGGAAAAPHAPPAVDPIVIPAARLAVDRSTVLGEGGFGAVYAATLLPAQTSGGGADGFASLRVGRAVAVKMLFPMGGYITDAQLRDFKREVAVQHEVGLACENVVTVRGLCTDLPGPSTGAPMAALVMDRMECGLDRVLYDPSVPLSVADKVQLLEDVAVGLAHLHSVPVVHGDVKSLNVLLDKHGRGRLSDFGMARVKATSRAIAASSGGKGRHGGGTVQWMAPELLDPDSDPPAEPSAATDAYALGMLFYEVVMRCMPWSELRDPQTQAPRWVDRGKRPALDKVPAGTPDALVELMTQLWAQEPGRRPHARQVVAALRQLKDDLGEEAPRAYMDVLRAASVGSARGASTSGSRSTGTGGASTIQESTPGPVATPATGSGSVAGEPAAPSGSSGGAVKEPGGGPPSAEDVRRMGVNELVATLRRFGEDATTVAAACAALRRAAEESSDQQDAIGKAGGIPLVVAALQAHAGNAGVVEAACWALWNLAANADNRVAIADADGILPVVEALTTHAGSEGVVKAACGALRNLADDNADNRDAIARAVVAMLQVHAGNAGVVVAACCALFILAVKDADNRVAIARAGGIQLVVAALRGHAGNADAVALACRALVNLAANKDDNKVDIVRAGGIPPVVEALKAHAGNAGVVEAACRLVINLAVNDDSKVAIARAGGILPVVEALKAHAGNAGVVKQACLALGNLAANADNCVAIARAGGIVPVMAALQTHVGNAYVVVAACRALLVLAANSNDVKASIRAAGAVPLLQTVKSGCAGAYAARLADAVLSRLRI